MEGLITDFDRDVHARKIGLFRDRFKEGGAWNYEVENGQCFMFVLKDGTQMEVLEYVVKKENPRYDQFRFLLAEINGVPVGFVSIGIHEPRKDIVVGKSNSNIGVLIKGKGIGSRLDDVKNYILQKEANKLGTIFEIGDDENKSTIETQFEKIEDEYNFDGDKEKYVRRLKELVEKRGYWLSLYGRDGKSGYRQLDRIYRDKQGVEVERKRKFFKRFLRSNKPPVLNCTIKENLTDLREEAEKIRW